MAGTIYVNTFGVNEERSFASTRDYHFQVMNALTERGYADVKGTTLEEGQSWIGEDGGYVVHAKLAKGGKAVFFMAQTEETVEKITEAVKLSIPGISLEPPVKISAPE